MVSFGNIEINLNKHLIIKNNEEFKINSTEKTILEVMINSPGKTFSREEIGNIIKLDKERSIDVVTVSYTHLRDHETREDGLFRR